MTSDELDARLIPGTEGNLNNLMFSPNGEWLAYLSDGQLQKIAVSGGASVALADVVGNFFGGNWQADGTILFSAQPGHGAIMRVSANGGTPETLFELSSEGIFSTAYPQLLPDGDSVLFTFLGTEGTQIAIQSLGSGETEVLFAGIGARYVPTGHIVYGLESTLFSVPFDLGTLETLGGPVPVVDGVLGTATVLQFGISDGGTLAYIPGSAVAAERSLLWVDRAGMEEALTAEPLGYEYPRISHDGQRVAVDEANQFGDIKVWNFASKNLVRLTSGGGADLYPVWTSDDRQIAFGSQRSESSNVIYWKSANNTGVVEPLTPALGNGTQPPNPYFFAAEDQVLVFREQEHPDTGDNIGIISLESDSEPVWLLASQFDERNAELSPDGNWMAYQSDESGQHEIYVRPFPNVEDDLRRISTAGGFSPLWARDGQELFYIEPGTPRHLMVVPVQTDPTFEHEVPLELLEWPYFLGNEGRAYDVSRDSEQFLAIKGNSNEIDEEDRPQINIVLNWFQELRERVPVP